MAAIGIGVAKAGAGIFGSITGHNAEADAARRQNQQLVNQYRQQLRIRDQDWKQRLGVYANKLGVYNQTLKSNEEAKSLALGRNQQRFNDIYRQQNVQTRNMLIGLAQGGGLAAAKGKTGRSSARLDTDLIGQYVRNQGVMGQNLMSARVATENSNMDVMRRLQAANNSAYSRVAIAPMQTVAPLKPVQNAGPSQMSLMANIGTSLLDGVSAGFGADAGLR